MVSDSPTFPCIVPAGDSAALIRFGSVLDFDVNAAVLEFDNYLANAFINSALASGVVEVTPALVSLLVRFDPLRVEYPEIESRLQQVLNLKDWLDKPVVHDPAHWQIPVHYGGEAGTDLTEVSGMLGVSEATAIEQHSGNLLRALTLGFAPGCCYLGMLPEAWEIPRLKVIKSEVPAGAILVAVRQTVMASAAMPTGWRCIGRTPLNNFDAQNIPPVIVKHGDTVQYQPVSEREFEKLQTLAGKGESIAKRVA